MRIGWRKKDVGEDKTKAEIRSFRLIQNICRIEGKIK